MAHEFEADKKFTVVLNTDDTVTDDNDSKNKGTWTMVYDEGFEI